MGCGDSKKRLFTPNYRLSMWSGSTDPLCQEGWWGKASRSWRKREPSSPHLSADGRLCPLSPAELRQGLGGVGGGALQRDRRGESEIHHDWANSTLQSDAPHRLNQKLARLLQRQERRTPLTPETLEGFRPSPSQLLNLTASFRTDPDRKFRT